MKNIIGFPINLSEVPIHIRKTFYIDDFLIKNEIIPYDNTEKLIDVRDIKIAPFWKDTTTFHELNDPELQSILDLEGQLLQEYVNTHPNFGIQVRETVANKLREANNYFKQYGFEIVIKIGYRPVEVQKKLFEKLYIFFQQKFKNIGEQELYNMVCEYVSDPDNFISPHTTGGAIDIILIDHLGNEVDMGSPINFPGDISHLTFQNITPEQKNNRNFLCDTMLKFGFANLSSEWWHFSYGDPYWAYFYGKKSSLYTTL